ncbi:MAG TPA: isocitrate/isopropylmalate family dehydrogenase [Thermoanaerobaculia bacterium]|nr:isocitrate/isopropylmalate family dehydrogenase [Thermoanaerobaculia bacterium]
MRIAVVPGDGIGPEVTREALKVLDSLRSNSTLGNHAIAEGVAPPPTRVNSLRSDSTLGRRRGHASGSDLFVEISLFPWSADHFLKTGETVPAGAFDMLARDFDAVLAGAFGDPRVPDGRHADEILLGMRRRLDLFANIRPVRALDDSVVSIRKARASDVDFVLFRENTEGAYSGRGRVVGAGTSDEEAVEEDVTTRRGVERICRAAFAFAAAFEKPRRLGRRPRVLMADKHNVQKRGGGLWHRVFCEVATAFPSCESRHLFADALAHEMVLNPASLDVVVTNNLFGDVLSDLGAALQGGLGLAPSGNVHPGRTSVFEPVHGSAPDLAGKGIANPFGSIRSLGMLLAHVGRADLAERVESAVAACVAAGETTRDLGGKLSTAEAGDAVVARLPGGKTRGAGRAPRASARARRVPASPRRRRAE